MALFQFGCPHCGGAFQVQDLPAGQAVACPHCGGGVALPSELPPSAAAAETAAEPPPVPAEYNQGIELPFEPRETHVAKTAVRPPLPPEATTRTSLTRAQRERRRAVRNLVLMIVGLIVLVGAALVLKRL
jgi:hypothetical protein